MSNNHSAEQEEKESTITDEDQPATCRTTAEEWKGVRELLKSALLANRIPIESDEMRPKEVWQKYVDAKEPAIQCIDYSVKPIRDKFTRMLRSLRKKHKEADLENEDRPNKAILWSKSAAKQYLKKCFREEVISTEYKDEEQIWKDHCEGHKGFARMAYNDAFIRRLGSVRDDFKKKKERSEKDLEAYNIAKKNHPTPRLNSRGEPQWNGSAAQTLLKELIAQGKHRGKAPQTLWVEEAEFQVYSKQTFRDHIYQEERLLKFQNYVEGLRKRKFDELQY